ncbi:MAG: DUF4276 family protein [Candidatus Parabeggiatoa sp.]|nr:DUF4276 family protein [Candidatus Parabeggiatoa sp.]
MLRIGISVEGATEREFVHQVISPYFSKREILITPVPMNGNISLDRIRHELPALLGSLDIVTTFYDLYGFKRRQGKSAEELGQAMLKNVKPKWQARLIPYVQQYEFETLVFSEPAIVAIELGEADKQNQIEAIVQGAGEPEEINDGVSTCPSRRLKALFPHYDKKFHGPSICQRIGLNNIRRACPRFNGWLIKLEKIDY